MVGNRFLSGVIFNGTSYRHNRLQFNNTEREMGKQTQVTSKETTWRNHLARHASSGKSISAFCRDEAISEGNFYAWRSRLRVATINSPSRLQKRPAPFIDLGVVKDSSNNAPLAHSNMEVRIDLGGGISLTITRY